MPRWKLLLDMPEFLDSAGPILNIPNQAANGSNRVNRGGSWNNNARNCRSANRNRNNPDNRNNNLGFRLCLSPAWKNHLYRTGRRAKFAPHKGVPGCGMPTSRGAALVDGS
jgi:hypothetical protein